jgi:hypothetical protein
MMCVLLKNSICRGKLWCREHLYHGLTARVSGPTAGDGHGYVVKSDRCIHVYNEVAAFNDGRERQQE